MDKRFISVAGLLLAGALAAPGAQAASAASGFAQIDWASVGIAAVAGAQYTVLGHEASVLFADNVIPKIGSGTPYVQVASDTVDDAPQLQGDWLTPSLGRLLMGQVDLGAGQKLASQYSRVNGGGTGFDAALSSWMLLLHSDAGGQIHVTGHYLLSFSAAVGSASESAFGNSFANVRLYDPGSGQVLFDDTRMQSLSVGQGALLSDTAAGSGAFDDLITLPAGRDVRLFFSVSSAATTAAVPEPAAWQLLLAGLAACLFRARRRLEA
ncbi:MAG: PEP-CTERM sorting domain-containing protein [Burkholderiales bacterium]|jgi:hypothetical protein|nr:PEP-CTERM sorting domain-containing protein [Burkholderiales bacterium]